jgi:hypothetical protein
LRSKNNCDLNLEKHAITGGPPGEGGDETSSTQTKKVKAKINKKGKTSGCFASDSDVKT